MIELFQQIINKKTYYVADISISDLNLFKDSVEADKFIDYVIDSEDLSKDKILYIGKVYNDDCFVCVFFDTTKLEFIN